MKPIKYIPVFVGKTEDGTRIVLYRNMLMISVDLYIRVGDGEVQHLSDGAEVETWFETGYDRHHISIVSPEWNGKASGTRAELVKEEGIRDKTF